MHGRTTIQKKLVRTALFVLIPSLVAVTLSVVGINVYLNGKARDATVSRIEASLAAKGRLIASNNAQALSGMVEGNAFYQIRDLVASTVKGDPDMAYGLFVPADSSNPCELADKSDSAAGQGRLARIGEIQDREIVGWARTVASLSSRRSGSGNRETMDFAAPVGPLDAPSGWIVYRISTRSMEEAIDSASAEARKALGGVVATLLALGAGALGWSLRKFRREAKLLSEPVRELAAAAEIIQGGDYKKPVAVESDDEIGDLAAAFETMRGTVQSYTEHLEELVEAKMRQVRDILDNVEQGLFAVNFDGSLSPEHSRAATEILGVAELESIQSALHLSPSQHEDFVGWLGLVRRKHATMRWEKLTKVAPVQDLELKSDDGSTRFVRIRYQRMYDKNRQVERIMVLAQDETEARRVERIVAEEKERHENEVRTILGLVNNLPEVIREFMADARRRIDSLEDGCRTMLDRSISARARHPEPPGYMPSDEEIGRIFRDLHTIKGNASTYGFERLGRLAHQAEDILDDLRSPVTVRTTETLRSLLGKLGAMNDAYQEILATERRLLGGGVEGDILVQVSERKLEHLHRMADALLVAAKAHPESEAVRTLAIACERIRDVPVPKLADKYRGMVQRLAERMGKDIRFDAQPHHLEVPPGFFARLDEAIVHILRNSVDHGIESPSARKAAGKAEQGSIGLKVAFDEEMVTVVLSDDGAGIDSAAVVEKAVELGAVAASDVDRLDEHSRLMLIFESGISTAGSVSDVSGRGVGMAAVRESIESQGGTVTIESTRGKGTRVTLQAPNRSL
jgi:signal transduction histidine kinase/HAMP domain-containing protein